MRLIYDVYDRETEELLFTGDYEEVKSKINISYSTLSNIVNGFNSTKYPYIIKINNAEESAKEIISYIKRHLDTYGNTVISRTQRKHLKVLIDEGYKIKTKPSIYDRNYLIVELEKNG